MRRLALSTLILLVLMTPFATTWSAEGVWDDQFASYAPPVVPGDVQEWRDRLYVGTGSYSDVVDSRSWIAVWDGRKWSRLEGFLDGLHESEDQPFSPGATGWKLDVHDDELLVAASSRSYEAPGTRLCRVASWNGSRWRVYGEALEGYVQTLGVAGGDVFVLLAEPVEEHASTDRFYRWNGESWEALNETGDLERFVWADDGAVHVAGTLRDLDGRELTGVLRWDGDGWTSVAPAPADPVVSLGRWQGTLLAGVKSSDGQGSLLLQWDGSQWNAFEAPLVGSDSAGFFTWPLVSSIQVRQERLVVTGRFWVEGKPDDRLHHASYDGTSWSTIGGVLDDYAREIVTWRGRPLAYGAFGVANGRSVHGIAWMGPAGWEELRRSSAIHGRVENLRVLDDGLWVTGTIFDAGGRPMYSSVVWDGSRWSGGIAGGGTASIEDVTEHQGQLVAAGSFRYEVGDSVASSPLAVREGDEWMPVRANWGGLEEGRNVVSWGNAIAVSGPVRLDEGPSFGRVAVWDGDSVDVLDTGERGGIHTLEVYEGRLFIGGRFYRLNGERALMVAAYDGTIIDPVAGGVGGEAIALEPFGDDLVVGGHFVVVGDTVSARAVALWNGSRWSALGEGFVADRDRTYGPRVAAVQGLAIHQGELYATGWFDRSGEVGVNNLARWDGAVWQPIGGGVGNPMYSADEGHALASFDGSLYVTGDFEVAGDVAAHQFTRWIEFSETARRQGIELDSIAPNPMNPMTRIRFTLAVSGRVRVDLYDTRGRHVRRVLDGSLSPGPHEAIWDGTDDEGRGVSSGVYLIRVRSPHAGELGKVTLIR